MNETKITQEEVTRIILERRKAISLLASIVKSLYELWKAENKREEDEAVEKLYFEYDLAKSFVENFYETKITEERK